MNSIKRNNHGVSFGGSMELNNNNWLFNEMINFNMHLNEKYKSLNGGNKITSKNILNAHMSDR